MNSDNTPPLPQPTRYTCPNCGFGWNEPSAFCPRCGAAQTPAAQQQGSPVTLAAYGCGFVVLGGLGACFSLLGINGRSITDPFLLIGLVLLAGALFFLAKLIRGGR